jgi:hypothetical protein
MRCPGNNRGEKNLAYFWEFEVVEGSTNHVII